MPIAKNQVARGPQTGEHNLRTSSVFRWGGMVPDGDPASIPPNRLRYAANVDFRNGNVLPRPGQAKLNAESLLQSADAYVPGLTDFQIGTRRSLYIVGDGCPSLSPGAGFYIGWLDYDLEPEFQPGIYYNVATLDALIAAFDGDLYVAIDNRLRQVVIIDNAFDAEGALAVSGDSQDLALLTLPSPFTTFRCLRAYDGRLAAGCDAGAGASKVLFFDGVTAKDDLTGINPPKNFGLYRESLILGYNGSPNHIRVRASGSSPGTWATVAPDFGTANFREGVSYKDRFYFTTDGETIYRFDGTTLNRITAATMGITAGSITFGIAVFNGFLYVAYSNGGAGGGGRIAKFDGTTWTPVEKNMTTQFATCTDLRPLAVYRGDLVAGGIDTATGGGAIYISPGTNTAGTWTRVSPDTVGTMSGDINHLLVY